jgi:hypothetical protein
MIEQHWIVRFRPDCIHFVLESFGDRETCADHKYNTNVFFDTYFGHEFSEKVVIAANERHSIECKCHIGKVGHETKERVKISSKNDLEILKKD